MNALIFSLVEFDILGGLIALAFVALVVAAVQTWWRDR